MEKVKAIPTICGAAIMSRMENRDVIYEVYHTKKEAVSKLEFLASTVNENFTSTIKRDGDGICELKVFDGGGNIRSWKYIDKTVTIRKV